MSQEITLKADVEAVLSLSDTKDVFIELPKPKSLKERVKFALEPTYKYNKFAVSVKKTSLEEAVHEDTITTDGDEFADSERTGYVLFTNRVYNLTVIDIDINKKSPPETINLITNMIMERLPKDIIVVQTPSKGLHIYCNTDNFIMYTNRLIDACSSTPYGSIVRGIDLIGSENALSSSGIMFAGSKALNQYDIPSPYTFVRGNIESTINYGVQEILNLLGFTLKPIVQPVAIEENYSNEKLDIDDTLAKVLYEGLEGITVHSERNIGISKKNDGINLIILCSALNALPDSVREEAYKFAYEKCALSVNARSKFDDKKIQYSGKSYPGSFIKILHEFTPKYYTDKVKPLMSKFMRERKTSDKYPGVKKPELDVINDNFKMQDIREKCPYDDLNEAKLDLLKVFRVVDMSSEIYLMKEYDATLKSFAIGYVTEEKAKKKLIKIIVQNEDKKAKRPKVTLWDIFMNNSLSFYIDTVAFYSDEPNVFSYFRGYQYSVLEAVKIEVIQPFLDHVYNIIADKNDEVYKYILMWIAKVLQTPMGKTGTGLLLLGDQGTGKNVFTDVVCKLMERYAIKNVSSLEHVVNAFNAILENKKLIVLNELRSVDVKTNMDVLKTIISEDTVTITHKSHDPYNTVNPINIIMCSNNSIPIKIENDDRRYMVTRTSSDHAQDPKYFDPLIQKFTPEFYENLFTFFMTMDISNARFRKLPETDAKDAIKEASMSVYELFIRDNLKKFNKGYKASDIYADYQNYCSTNGYSPAGKRTFTGELQRFCGKSHAVRIKGISTAVYTLIDKYAKRFDEMNKRLVNLICEDNEEEDANVAEMV